MRKTKEMDGKKMTFGRKEIVFALSITLVMMGTVPCCAQPLPKIYDSVEWMAVNSSIIVVGTIEEITLQKYRFAQIKISVSETLKGEESKNISFVMRIGNVYNYKAELQKLNIRKKRETKVLLFLGHDYHTRNPSPISKHIKYEPWGPGSPAHYYAFFTKEDNKLPRIPKTMGLESIKDYADLISRTRSAITAARKFKPWDSFKYSWSRSARLQMEYVRVPVDVRLEKLAKKWLRSEDAWWQQYGAYALYHFPIEQNRLFIEMLYKKAGKAQRKMLSDVLNQWQSDARIEISHLVQKLSDPNNPYQWKPACRILASRGAKAKAALPTLKKLEGAENPHLRIAATVTIKKIMADINEQD